jgi:hypothetical protein
MIGLAQLATRWYAAHTDSDADSSTRQPPALASHQQPRDQEKNANAKRARRRQRTNYATPAQTLTPKHSNITVQLAAAITFVVALALLCGSGPAHARSDQYRRAPASSVTRATYEAELPTQAAEVTVLQPQMLFVVTWGKR